MSSVLADKQLHSILWLDDGELLRLDGEVGHNTLGLGNIVPLNNHEMSTLQILFLHY